MIGLDTNVLVRYIVQDDPEQSHAAERLIESRCTVQSPGYVGIPVLVELVWVLTTAYRYDRSVVASVVRQLLRTAEFLVEDRETAWMALREFEAGGTVFADCLIGHRNRARGCDRTYTFDRGAARGHHFKLVS
ncbi:MAG: type II toxin-antitoxin system VapC family toxin [Immundisolibacterales bacterium]|nr:type II toxin-antitoxin system VapC family toxin [Immundisolibacterales bacterium]